ncbi:MAG: DNA primase catalytic subunit PriS [Methanotrichaceae archaeon]
MKILTRNFLISKFREYYLSTSLDLPPGFESREWGFILFDDIGMRRHKSYMNRGEITDYVRSMVPAHLYHSAAYYKRPAAPTMKEKEWMGADLIFDLDADHLRNVPESYSEMLDMVKKETLKLLAFLTEDFGLSERNISVVFSGGRGYHIHVRDPRVLSLGSDERREILDYLTFRGGDIDRLFIKKVVSGDIGTKRAIALKCPSEGSPGWGGRINQAVIQYAESIRNLDDECAIKKLTEIRGIGEVRAAEFLRYFRADQTLKDIREGNLDAFKSSSLLMGIAKGHIVESAVQGLGGETDEPVTADIRRLIRCPGSLHGGSGFRVTPLTLKALEDFNPLMDAVVFGDDPVPVDITRPFSTEIHGESYKLKEGKTEVPACAAVFLMARGVAELGQSF